MARFKHLQLCKEAARLFLISGGIMIKILVPWPGIYSDSAYRAMPYQANTDGQVSPEQYQFILGKVSVPYCAQRLV